MISATKFLETTVNDQLTRLYIITGVPHHTKFIPRTRNEIRAVQWFNIADLPTNKKDALSKSRVGYGSSSFFMVFPFVRFVFIFFTVLTSSINLKISTRKKDYLFLFVFYRLIRNWVAGELSRQQTSTNRKKLRRKSLEEQSFTGFLKGVNKPAFSSVMLQP